MEFKPNGKLSSPLYKQPNFVRRCNVPLAITNLAVHMLHALRRAIFQTLHAVAIRRHNLKASVNHVNADATDETKIVTTKFALGFCHGQLRFCLLVRIGPYFAMSTSMPPEGSEIFHKKESFFSFPVRL